MEETVREIKAYVLHLFFLMFTEERKKRIEIVKENEREIEN